jgi:hypothetical protein
LAIQRTCETSVYIEPKAISASAACIQSSTVPTGRVAFGARGTCKEITVKTGCAKELARKAADAASRWASGTSIGNGIESKCAGVAREGIDARVTAKGTVKAVLLVHNGLIVAFEALEFLVARDAIPRALFAKACHG